MKYTAVSLAHGATFSWAIADDEQREVVLLIKVKPEQRESAQHDLNELVAMMATAGLEPQMNETRVRLSRNDPPSVTMFWRGFIHDVADAERLLNRTAELWATEQPNARSRTLEPVIIDNTPEEEPT